MDRKKEGIEGNSGAFCVPRWLSDKESASQAGDEGSVPGGGGGICWEDPLKKGMATHSSILAWRIPRTEKPGRLQSMESQKSWT